jgi:plasmid maintenance system antidote protein VapI
MGKNKKPPISDLLRKTIAENRIPYLVLERETGVVRTSIMRFVRGETSLRLDKADVLAEYFGLELVKKRKAK